MVQFIIATAVIMTPVFAIMGILFMADNIIKSNQKKKWEDEQKRQQQFVNKHRLPF